MEKTSLFQFASRMMHQFDESEETYKATDQHFE